MTKYNFISTAIISVFLIAFFSCSGGPNSEAESKEEEVLPEDIVELRGDQKQLAGIETGAIEMRSITTTLKVSGRVTVAPQNLATVCMPLGGFVKSTTLMPGNAVSKGQTLVILENQEFIDIQLNYLEAKNKFEFAEAEYNRMCILKKTFSKLQRTIKV
jgi:cobalt-zinc-cadmium efflux system membrane fusion protein